LIVCVTIEGNHYTDLPILPSLTACGIVLIFVSLLGIYGSFKHHQVFLFFYMIIMFCLFIVQFSIAASCLAVNTQKEENFAEEDWGKSSDELKKEIETDFHCTGFNATAENSCVPKIIDQINSTFKLSGSLAIAFSFTEVSNHEINANLNLLMEIPLLDDCGDFDVPISQPKETSCKCLPVKR
jgi:hypothetical protein